MDQIIFDSFNDYFTTPISEMTIEELVDKFGEAAFDNYSELANVLEKEIISRFHCLQNQEKLS